MTYTTVYLVGHVLKILSCNKNVVATLGHNEYKDVLLKNKCLRHSMNRIPSKHHTIGTYEISKI